MFKGKLKYVLLTSLSIILILILFMSTSATEQVLKIGMDASDIASMAVWDLAAAQNEVIKDAVFEKLATYRDPGDAVADIVPQLAISWEHSDDFKEWTFRLREGVQFHKGYGELTAEDVKFSLDQIRNPEIGNKALQSFFTDIEDVIILDKYTLRIVLNVPEPKYAFKISQSNFGMYVTSKKAFEELGEGLKTNPIGTGPFEFAEYKSMEYSKMVRFDGYWGKKAKLDAFIVYYMPDVNARNIGIKSGNLHIIKGLQDALWKSEIEEADLIYDMLGHGYSSLLFFNLNFSPLDNKLVREAIAYAINREEIAYFYGAKPQISPVPSTWLFHTTEGVKSYDYNPEKSREKLSEAGFHNGLIIGPQYVTEASFYRNQYEIIQSQLREVGIDLQIVNVDHTTFHSRNREGVQPFPLMGTAIADGQAMFFSYFHTQAGPYNFSGYDGLDELLNSSMGKSYEETNKIIAKAQEKVMEELIVYPTIEVGIPLAMRPEVVLGYEPKSSLNSFYSITVDTYLK